MGLPRSQNIKIFGTITSIVLFFLMWCLFGWSYDIHDYSNYLDYYLESPGRIDLGFVDIGYNYLNYWFYSAEWTFVNFRILYSLLCLLLLYNLIYKYSRNPVLCLLIYFICIYFVDLVQMRNFLAYLICFNGFNLLINNTRFGKVKYFILVSLAVTIHIACAFYFIFLITPIQKRLNWKKILFISSIATLSIPRLIQLTVIALGLAIHDSLFYYSLYALIPSTVILLFNILVINNFSNISFEYNNLKSQCTLIGTTRINSNFIYNCNVLFLFLMPLCYMSSVSMRLDRNFFIINLIYITNIISLKKWTISYSQFILFSIYIIFYFIYFEYCTDVIPNILANNYIL